MLKNTPGPWEFTFNPYIKAAFIMSPQHEVISYKVAGDCDGDTETMIANAKLQAAAPEMLDALGEILDINDRLFELSLNEQQREVWAPRIEKVRAVYLKATT